MLFRSNSFNVASFATFFTATVSVSNNTVGYYQASYFNTTQLILSAVSIFANLTPALSTGSFTHAHVIEYCRRASISSPWFVDTVLSSIAPFTPLPRKTFSIPGPFGTTTVGSLATGVLVTFTGFTPVVIPSGTDFCIRVKVLSYTTAPVFPAVASVPTDTATKIRIWEAVATPLYTFNGTARNLGPFLASTGGQLGLIVDSPGPVVPLLTSDSFAAPTPVPQITMEFTSP